MRAILANASAPSRPHSATLKETTEAQLALDRLGLTTAPTSADARLIQDVEAKFAWAWKRTFEPNKLSVRNAPALLVEMSSVCV